MKFFKIFFLLFFIMEDLEVTIIEEHEIIGFLYILSTCLQDIINLKRRSRNFQMYGIQVKKQLSDECREIYLIPGTNYLRNIFFKIDEHTFFYEDMSVRIIDNAYNMYIDYIQKDDMSDLIQSFNNL